MPQLAQSTQTMFEAAPLLDEETESEEAPALPRGFCLSLGPRLRAPWPPLCLWPSSVCDSAMNELDLPSGCLIRGTSVTGQGPCLLAQLCSRSPAQSRACGRHATTTC